VRAGVKRTAASSSRNAPAEHEDGLRARLPGVRVLVLDDHEDARRILRMVFEYCGAYVVVGDSGEDVVRLVRCVRPHVVITDIAMPRGDGYGVVHDIRALAPDEGGRTPVLAVTAYRELHHEVRARRAGFDAWLTKPIDIRRICSVVERLARDS